MTHCSSCSKPIEPRRNKSGQCHACWCAAAMTRQQCSGCDRRLDPRATSGRCRACARSAREAERNAGLTCLDCNTPITWQSRSGRCHPCANLNRAAARAEAKAAGEHLGRLTDRERPLSVYDLQYDSAFHASASLREAIQRVGLTEAPAKPREPLTFEEQLARVQAGARLVEVPRIPTRPLSHSAVGCAAAMVCEG